MRRQLFFGLIVLVLSACSNLDEPTHSTDNLAENIEETLAGNPMDKSGYLGFQAHQVWAIQFNDCTVYKRTEALKYLWFDRTLTQISCYHFKPSDIQALPTPSIRIYAAPNLSASVMEIERFEEMSISKSGWGSFPPVYEQFQDSSQSTWLRVKEGWLHISQLDNRYVAYYVGSQDEKAEEEHHAYYLTH